MPRVVLVRGPERVLADRAVEATLAEVRAHDPDVEVVRVEVDRYEAGALRLRASPSLFGHTRVLLVRDADEGSDDVHADLLDYLAAPADDVTLVVVHKGGNRGKKVLDACTGAGARVLPAPAIKTDRDKTEFVLAEFRRGGRRIEPAAVRRLVEAVGKDVSELASACSQLVEDTEGLIDEEVVERYHGGRIEATGFRVADAVVAGGAAQALRLLRHAIASGVDPVPIVAVLASQLRQLVRVSGAGRGPSASVATSLGLAPWQVDRARRALGGWDDEALGTAIQAVAVADWEVKGASRDPVYAVEHAVLAVTQARRDGC